MKRTTRLRLAIKKERLFRRPFDKRYARPGSMAFSPIEKGADGLHRTTIRFRLSHVIPFRLSVAIELKFSGIDDPLCMRHQVANARQWVLGMSEGKNKRGGTTYEPSSFQLPLESV